MTKKKLSPGMQQYLDIKENYPDAFLLFRMGDFYELFYDDAIKAAQILELTLTSRNKNADDPIAMAGVPYHSAQQYIDILVDQGYKVAIAEQMEDPKKSVGVVKREVVQVITPGTAVDSQTQSAGNNFLVAIDSDGETFGLAYMDLSTGEFFATQLTDFTQITNEIQNLKAKEVVVGFELTLDQEDILCSQLNLLISKQDQAVLDTDLISEDCISEIEQSVAGKLLGYVQVTQKRQLSHLQAVKHYAIRDYLQMTYASKRSLDLLENARTGKKFGSLYWLLDETKTAMGTRLLRQWIDRPLLHKAAILQRQNAVTALIDNFFERVDLTESLKGVYDIERLASRISFGKASPKDLLQLGQTLQKVPQIKERLRQFNNQELDTLESAIDALPSLAYMIMESIDPDAPATITEGGIIKSGFDEQLDRYRTVMRDGQSWILDLEAREREQSGIANLKIDYNRKDGYYFHVTNSQLDKVPDYFFRKATLKNSERFGTTDLAKIEGEMLEAREKSANLEYDIFLSIRQKVESFIKDLQVLARHLATVDVLQSLAVVSENQHYHKPQFNDHHEIAIVEGRHPVVEKVFSGSAYVPNSITLTSDIWLQLITGPNMSGKSTYMRQLALIVILAQLGCYVPAKSADLPVFDAIFTRIGAADDLISGQSTFMLEMMEANAAMELATENSLILFDELGRGTATYDGMALAQAIIEHIHDHIGAKTLFATHYHELTSLSTNLTHLENVHVATLEQDGQVTFLHQISSGPADKSYGIHVAKIAGLPTPLLQRAATILDRLENQEVSLPVESSRPTPQQTSLFESEEVSVIDKLRDLDLNTMTPMEAMTALYELKKELTEEI
ncbi:DNA mismatch repair protein MutS [Streptococcus sp. DD12]|uniref:DNA mismatch repair protein MutS n=1 Tax=Streptococcus sp. DD12 TaxID=1777880 RepID=UPI000792BC11|nr:DNA mismatch repair protein MutS [Streptococcus sp. DD12]KXT76072.1 DNA mismatch repair protein MutS [Streptococcus sp. DD12]